MNETCANLCAANMMAVNSAIAASASASEAENLTKERKLSYIGRDQIVLKTKMGIEFVGYIISKTNDKWMYKNGKIYKKETIGEYQFDVFAIITMLAFLSMAIAWFFSLFLLFSLYPRGILGSVILAILVEVLAVICFPPTEDDLNKEIEYIRISTLKNMTVVLIRIYDSRGYRNIDDDRILEIKEKIETE